MIIGAYVYTSDSDAIYYADVNEIFRYGEREGGRGRERRREERERGREGEGREGGRRGREGVRGKGKREGEGERGEREGGRETWILLDSRS